MIFKTRRLTVREFNLTDLDDFYTMQSNPNVMRHIKPVLSYEESESELNLFISNYSDSEKFYNLWAIEHSGSKAFIGLCGVYQNKNSNFELAYRLTESAWGVGYGSEVAESLIRYCLEDLKLKSIVAFATTENKGSIKILEKYMNFVEEKPHPSTGILGRKYTINT